MTLRKEDYEINRPQTEFEDIIQYNLKPETSKYRGVQFAAGFLATASKLDEVMWKYYAVHQAYVKLEKIDSLFCISEYRSSYEINRNSNISFIIRQYGSCFNNLYSKFIINL